MVELVKEHNLPPQKTYTQLAYINSGYANVLLAARQVTNGSDKQNP